MKIIYVKTLQEHFIHAWNDIKPNELRKNDKNYQQGDVLVQCEIVKNNHNVITYTGREITSRILLVTDYQKALRKGYVCLSLRHIHKIDDSTKLYLESVEDEK